MGAKTKVGVGGLGGAGVESSREGRSGQEGVQAGQDAGKLTGQQGAPSDFGQAHGLAGASRGSHSGDAQFGCLTTR